MSSLNTPVAVHGWGGSGCFCASWHDAVTGLLRDSLPVQTSLPTSVAVDGSVKSRQSQVELAAARLAMKACSQRNVSQAVCLFCLVAVAGALTKA